MLNGRYKTISRVFPLLLVLVFVFAACGEEGGGGRFKRSKKKKAQSAKTEEAVSKGSDELVLPELTEAKFIASPRSRDPFKLHGEVVARAAEVQQSVQREVKLKEFDVSELQLIGIITNIGDPRAMVTTPEGVGFVLRRGDYVGRPDYIDAGSGGDKIQVNWRIARIHGTGKEDERGVYLVREDPSAPAGRTVNRFMPLHPQD